MTDNMNIQWYPCHMTKTRRQIEADLKLVDAVRDRGCPDPRFQPESGY